MLSLFLRSPFELLLLQDFGESMMACVYDSHVGVAGTGSGLYKFKLFELNGVLSGPAAELKDQML